MVLFGGKNKSEIIKVLKDTKRQIALGLSITALCGLGSIYSTVEEKDNSSGEITSYVELKDVGRTDEKIQLLPNVPELGRIEKLARMMNDNVRKETLFVDSFHDDKSESIKPIKKEEVEHSSKELIKLLKNRRLLLNYINNEVYEEISEIDKLGIIKDGFEKEITVDNMYLYTREQLIEYICKKYNLERYQFNTIATTVRHETMPNNYDDNYRVINTIYNRTKSKNWVESYPAITDPYGNVVNGSSMYAQVIAKNQFSGCVDKTGSDFDTLLSEVSYDGTIPFETTLDAIIDFLISEECVHSYLSFKSYNYPIDGDKFTDYGNKYHDLMKESDVLDPNYVIIEADKSLVLTRRMN